MNKLYRQIARAHPLVKLVLMLLAISIFLLALHDLTFNITSTEVRKYIRDQINVNLVLLISNSYLLLTNIANLHKYKGENEQKHREHENKIKHVYHYNRSNKKQIEILNRRQSAQEAKIQILEDLVVTHINNCNTKDLKK